VTRTARVALAAAGAAALAWLLDLGVEPDVDAREPRELALGAPPKDVATDGEERLVSSPPAEVAPHVEVERPREPLAADPGGAEPDAGSTTERIVGALAASLQSSDWRRAAWDDELGATSDDLPQESRDELARLLADPVESAARRVAAAELLRAGGVEREKLAAADAGPMLRLAAFDGREPEGVARSAARSLAWLGEDSDRERLIDELLAPRPASTPPAGDERGAVAWALRAAPAGRLLPALARRLDGKLDEGATELALVTIEGALRDAAGELPRAAILATESALEGVLTQAEVPEKTVARALLACAALGERSEESRAAALLASVVADAHLPAERRLRAAESLARLGSPRASLERRAAVEHLVAAARDGATSRERRRAWSALALAGGVAPLEDLVGLSELAEIARAEPDPGVRELAQRSLERLR
jgi:hypothetical protein